MITHNGARTRALYKWEMKYLIFLNATGRNSQLRSAKEGQLIVDRIWDREQRTTVAPTVYIRPNKGYPYYYNMKIILTEQDHWSLTLVHECTHALGYGSNDQMHGRAFVLKYIDLMVFHFAWDREQLEIDAKERGLI